MYRDIRYKMYGACCIAFPFLSCYQKKSYYLSSKIKSINKKKKKDNDTHEPTMYISSENQLKVLHLLAFASKMNFYLEASFLGYWNLKVFNWSP